MKLDPQILLICQWNEFAGQPGGPPGQYVDSYNSSLTNDMEPISLSECAYVRPGDKDNFQCVIQAEDTSFEFVEGVIVSVSWCY